MFVFVGSCPKKIKTCMNFCRSIYLWEMHQLHSHNAWITIINVFSPQRQAYWWDDVCKDFNMLCLLKVHSSKPTVTQLFVNHNHIVCCCLFVLKSLSLDSLCIKINKQIVTDDNLVNYLHFWFIFSLSYVHNSTLHYQPLCKPSSRKWFSYRSGFLNWGLLLYLK